MFEQDQNVQVQRALIALFRLEANLTTPSVCNYRPDATADWPRIAQCETV